MKAVNRGDVVLTDDEVAAWREAMIKRLGWRDVWWTGTGRCDGPKMPKWSPLKRKMYYAEARLRLALGLSLDPLMRYFPESESPQNRRGRFINV
jgi:hypothetical protein